MRFLMMLISFYILLALISYDPLDQSIAQFGIEEIFGYFGGDETVLGTVAQIKNWLGIPGAIIAYLLYKNTIGYAIIMFPIFLFLWGRSIAKLKTATHNLMRFSIIFLLFGICFAILMGALQHFEWGLGIPDEWSGTVGYFVASIFSHVISPTGVLIMSIVGFIIVAIFGFDGAKDKIKNAPKDMVSKLKNADIETEEYPQTAENVKNADIEKEKKSKPIASVPDQDLKTKEEEKPEPELEDVKEEDGFEIDITSLREEDVVSSYQMRNEGEEAHPNFDITRDEVEPLSTAWGNLEEEPSDSTLDLVVEPTTEEEIMQEEGALSTAIHDEEIDYQYPTIEFLNRTKDETQISEEELKSNSKIIKESSISSLSSNIAMALKAEGIRIIAPIPGKGTVGIEIPNSRRTMIRFHDVVNTRTFAETKAQLPLALGKTISGEIYIADLAKMPHLLIAGATGAGKSVGMNSIICSLLYKKHPSELKFIIIDPKRVEMNQYSDLEHLFLATSKDMNSRSLIINEPEEAKAILQSTVKEMENRYEVLEQVRLRSITEYNTKVEDGTIIDVPHMVHRKMPYIILIVDEFADLMMAGSKKDSRKDIETPLARLAQMARAVGIHLVLATQRPSTDVITGLIKANFPARIAYRVNSGIDSRTILDQNGAEKLLGNGDMLCMPPGIAEPIRVQNAFIDTDEVENICNFMKEQHGYSMPYILPPAFTDEDDDGERSMADLEDRDTLFEDAARLVVEEGVASVSMIQRKLKVGYARAGAIIDQLECAGIVGKFRGSKSRDVLLQSISDLESIL
ncbi:MAG: cell division protein FtsK [Bacteroidetes bacterium 4572_77]|nr:MAG: cell division protein FtsK [Bacteroidetes bacterium 4572_77]